MDITKIIKRIFHRFMCYFAKIHKKQQFKVQTFPRLSNVTCSMELNGKNVRYGINPHRVDVRATRGRGWEKFPDLRCKLIGHTLIRIMNE